MLIDLREDIDNKIDLMGLNEQIKRIKTIMFIKEQSDKPVDYCKNRKDEIHQVYDKAKSWWYSWLDSEQSKTNFSKDFNLSLEETTKIFEKMRKVVDFTKLVFTTRTLDAEYAETFCNTPLYCKITLNCLRPFESQKHYTIFVHEIQHALNYFLKFSKYKIDFSQKLNNIFNEDVMNFDPEKFKQKAYKIGLDDKAISGMTKAVRFFQETGEKMIFPNEMMSRVYAVRSMLGINYPEKFTIKDLVDNVKNTNAYYIILAILNTVELDKDFETKIQELLDVMNSVAKNDKPENMQINLA
jgi:hypothetical protein